MIKALTLEVKKIAKVGKLILLVEDDQIIAAAQKKNLNAHGYDVVLVHSGEQALSTLKGGEHIDLVLMDLELGAGMNGLEAARRILQEQSLPIVFLTAHTDRKHVEQFESISSYGYVGKYSAEFELHQTIKCALDLFDARLAFEKKSQALSESEERYYKAFASNTDSINVNAMDGTYVDINEGFTRLLGYTREDVLGITSLDLDIWADPADRDKMIRGLRERGGVDDMEFIFRCKDGTFKTGLMTARIIMLKDEPHILTITKDITESKKIEEALRNSEAHYRSLFELAVDGIVTGSHEGVIMAANQSFCAMLGVHAEDVVGKYINMIPFTRDSMERSPLRFDLLHKGEVVKTERSIVRPDGSELIVEMHTKMMPDGTYQSIYRDITERRQAEELLRERERLFTAMFYSSSNLMALSNIDSGIFLDVSDSFLSILGYTREEVIGKSAFDLNIWVDPQARPRAVSIIKQQGYLRNFESKIYTKSREVRDALFSMSSVLVGGETYLMTAMTDLTEYNKLKDQLQTMQKLETIGVLAGGIAHDLNNLLSGIFGYLQLAQLKAPKDCMIMPYIDGSFAGYDKAVALAKRLLTYSKGDQLEKKTILLQQVIPEWVNFNLSGTGNITVDLSAISRQLWPVNVDVTQLNQVVSNLVVNARQAMAEKGVITVSAENIVNDQTLLPMLPAGNYVMLSVRDTGPGIPAENLSRIFDPFFTTKPTGTGLGLFTVYSIIKKHGGHLIVDSAVGDGATFKIVLPAVPGSGVDVRSGQGLVTERWTGKILLMDDDEAVRNSARIYLEGLGFEVMSASDGKEAISLFEQGKARGERFDLCILDLTVRTGMGGNEALQCIRSIDPDVKAIVASGYSSEAPVMNDPQRFGFLRSIGKPYFFEDLYKVLKEVIPERVVQPVVPE